MGRILNNIIAVFVIIILLLLVIPLNPFMLDMLFIINITVSLIILLITMYISEPLEFSVFPSMLLITTLFRLGLNISSTRLILTAQGKAGKVIETFGKFVLQGNVIVGTIIFIIIVLVQFIVITKGAERVSEVAARFTLDAMPGKQMAIDADLSSGLIDEQEARRRRHKIQKEADFYGAMDGATKIVKGDAIMSIIITIINFIAGIIIGSVQGSLQLEQVLQIYSIATIGDGLVSQIPALFISTATGMIVTRSVSEGSLNKDVIGQFGAQPLVLMIAGGLMLMMTMIPGAPKIQPVMLATLLLWIGYQSRSKIEKKEVAVVVPEEDQSPEEMTEEEYYKSIDNVYNLINVEPIELEFGYSLIPLVDESSGGNLINRIVIFRRQLAQDMGFVIPSIRLRDNALLNTNQYMIRVKGEEVATGEILVDYYLALEPPDVEEEVDGIETVEPAYGIPSKWVTYENIEKAELYGYTIIDPLSVMVTHLSEVIKSHAYELLTRTEMMSLLNNAKKQFPELVEEVVPGFVSYGDFQKILSSLLKERIPIKDMQTIMETVLNSVQVNKDLDLVTENVRVALKRTITRKFCEGGQLRVITLDGEVERAIIASLKKTDQGVYLALEPEFMHNIVNRTGELIEKFKGLSQNPIILTSGVIRLYFYRFIEQFYPNIVVLSFNEIGNNVQIQSLGEVIVN